MKPSSVILSTLLALMLIAASAWANSTTEGAKKSTSTTHSASKSTTHAKSASKPATPPMDLNSASKEELLKLPGMNDATADKIIASRPYKTSDELVSKGVVTKAEFDKLHKHVTAKSAPTAAAH